jgi:CheY-like chemotaxis protein
MELLTTSHGRALLVGPESITRDLQATLTDQGWTCEARPSPSGVLQRLRTDRKLDVVLLAPDATWDPCLELCRHIKYDARTAFVSVVFLTTLIGAGQGLFLALFAAELAGAAPPASPDAPGGGFLVLGGMVAFVLTAIGLFASTFHLGRPERGWRAAAMWRTSWLSREVIVLPLFMAGSFCWTAAHFLGLAAGLTGLLGLLTTLACAALFVCTGMVYASIRFLQEWASPLTLVNYTVLGLASGCTLATALAALWAAPLVGPFGAAALIIEVYGGGGRQV